MDRLNGFKCRLKAVVDDKVILQTIDEVYRSCKAFVLQPTKIKIFTQEEVDHIGWLYQRIGIWTESFHSALGTAYVVAATGLRPVEVCWIKMKDIDLSKNRFRVMEAKRDATANMDQRWVTMDALMIKICMDNKHLGSEYAFHRTEKPLPSTVPNLVKRVLDCIGREDLTAKDLRASAAKRDFDNIRKEATNPKLAAELLAKTRNWKSHNVPVKHYANRAVHHLPSSSDNWEWE